MKTNNKNNSNRMLLKKVLRMIISRIMQYSGLLVFFDKYSRGSIRILTYHGIESKPSNSYSVEIYKFEEQMIYLKENYNIVSLKRYEMMIEKQIIIPNKTIAITFDDGFNNFYSKAYPILYKYKIPATCFIITNKIDYDPRFMSWNEIKNICEEGIVTFGSHTLSHNSLAKTNNFELQREVVESKNILENKLGNCINYISYPYGTRRDIDSRCLKIIEKTGYKMAFTSINGVNSHRTNPFSQRRTKIEWGDNFNNFKNILRGGLDIWMVFDCYLPFAQRKGEVHF
jgi:peptidoglycan/xylan/chitin deacetylase (PgdA/CDA1 family)